MPSKRGAISRRGTVGLSGRLAEVTRQMNLSRGTVAKWWRRWVEFGDAGLVDRDSRPCRSPRTRRRGDRGADLSAAAQRSGGSQTNGKVERFNPHPRRGIPLRPLLPTQTLDPRLQLPPTSYRNRRPARITLQQPHAN